MLCSRTYATPAPWLCCCCRSASLGENFPWCASVTVITFAWTYGRQAVAGLSYAGDFRMTYGENPYKVANIVNKNMPLFRELYSPVLQVGSRLSRCVYFQPH